MLTCGLTGTKEPSGVATTNNDHDPPRPRQPQRSRGIFAHHGAPSEAGAALLTCGIGGLWPFIDGIIILATDSKDANGLPLKS